MSLPQKNQNPQDFQELQSLFQVVEAGKRRWEATFDAIVDPVMLVSSEYLIERANMAAAHSAGMEIQELIGKHCYQAFAKRNSPCENCPIQGLDHQSLNFSRKPLHPFSDGRDFMASAFPMQGKSDTAGPLFVLQYHPMQDFRRVEAELLQKEKMASMGLFASGLAHDLNNPLAGVLAFAQLAMQGVDSQSQLFDDLKEIEKGALRCKKIIEDLMALYKPLSREEWKHLDLAALIENILPSLQVQFKDAGHELKTDLAKLPSVVGHESKLEQVFTNLIANAFQALEKKGQVLVTAKLGNDEIEVSIQDTGPGIPEDQVKRVFDPYFTSKGKRGGTGLGLPISYHIIKEHGGRIEVQSKVGQGSLFKVFLPRGGN